MRFFLCVGFLWLLSFGLYAQQQVGFSPLGGIFEEACEITLSFPDEACSIHYTLNGSTPTIESSTYQGPLTLSESLYSTSDIYTLNIHSPLEEDYCPSKVRHAIVIRAAAFDASGQCVSPVTTQSYFVKCLDGDTHGLPVSFCPNPSSGSGFLSFQSESSGLMTMSVFNCLGQKVFSKTVVVQNNDNTIPLHLDLSAGIYVIQIGKEWGKMIIY